MSRPPAIHILTPSLAPYDAIGNDVIQMRAALSESGYSVNLFAEGIHPARAAVARPLSSAPDEIWQSPEDILIYHHSIGWPAGEKILFKARNRIILRYHNITPARFFAPYSPPHEQACEAGVESTKRIAQIPNAVILGDSNFNCEDFIALGIAPKDCRVLAPFHLTEELGREQFDISTAQQYSGDVVNILFVGGIKPNKGHARAIGVFAAYRRHFNERSRLIFAGGMDERLDSYVQDLRRLAASLGVAEHVTFTGSVTGSQIKILYTAADVFLCTSEHEGFCVPLLEAMYFRTPIVAWGVTAVPETLGGCGFLLENWDEFLFASHIAKLVEDSELAVRFGDLGRKRYSGMFAPEVLRRRMAEVVAEVAQGRTQDGSNRWRDLRMNPLRIAYIVQRYGLEVNGGSEAHCRFLAERMAKTHHVDVLTTRAIDYVTWKDEYPEGAVDINGVCVRRFGVDHPRIARKFAEASQRVFGGPHTEEDEIRWMKLQGPYSSRLIEYLAENRTAYDVFVFQTYLYCTTYFGLPLVCDRAVLVPTAHDEPPIYLGIFDKVIPKARYLLYLTPEERAFLQRRFPQFDLKGEVVGLGVDPVPEPAPDPQWNQILERIGNSPFILYVGRIDESKGCNTLIEYFERYVAESTRQDLKLVMVGKPVMSVPDHPQLVVTGFIPEATKLHAIRNCRLMVAPSPYESLCIVALEAWMLRKPVLANGNCAVLRGQCIRSNGGLWYVDYAEFRESMNYLLGDDSLAGILGRQGEMFVRNNYTWQEVDRKLNQILSSVAVSSSGEIGRAVAASQR